MSGIVCIVNLDGSPIERSLLQKLTAFMAFRGPDAQQTWCEDGAAGLGHTLLRSTLESDHEQQPATIDGRVWITADARIDGRAELMGKLRETGHGTPKDAPDVELILHAYRAWGENCLDHLSGDFVFALWDGPRRRLFCARDHFGVVPFYYARVGESLVCSNTLDCLRQHPAVSDALNPLAIADHLIFGSNQEWETTRFADIQRLPPAHRLSGSAGAVRVERYWTLPDAVETVHYRRPADYVDRFLELFDQATADRLQGQNAGILMSGGLDSTSVAASAKRVLAAQAPYDLRAYTWVYERIIPDQERHFAGLAAQALDIPIEFLVADEHYVDPSQENAQPSPLQRVASFARVMLSGLGGDPALYPDKSYWITALGRGQLRRLFADVRAQLRLRGRPPPLYLRANAARWLGRPLWRPPYPSWLRADFAERLDLRRRLARVTDERLSDRARSGMISPFWADVLTNRDPDHTRVPVRMRHPFFDLRLIAYLRTVPTVPWFADKYLLRAALKGVLPDAVRLRPKTLMASWPHHALVTRQGVPTWMEDLARTPELAPYVDLAALWEGLHTPHKVKDFEYQSMVRALTLAVWLRRSGLSSTGPDPAGNFSLDPGRVSGVEGRRKTSTARGPVATEG